MRLSRQSVDSFSLDQIAHDAALIRCHSAARVKGFRATYQKTFDPRRSLALGHEPSR